LQLYKNDRGWYSMHTLFGSYLKNFDKITDFSAEILNILGFGVVIIDADTHEIVYANSRVFSMSGYNPEDILGKECHNLLCPAEVGFCPIMDLGQSVDNSERKMLRKNGEKLPIVKTVVPITLEGKQYLIESILDNSEQKDMQKKLIKVNETLKMEIEKREKIRQQMKYLAYHDHLTGLPNKLLFHKQLNDEVSLVKDSSKMLAVMFLDLDGFKMINDTMGHANGDLLLIEVSKRLVTTLRKCDLIARIGGDEFAILIKEITDMDSIYIIADQIINSFSQAFTVHGQELFVTTSLGIALAPVDGDDTEILIKNADIAMYKAKEAGRNQWTLCTSAMKRSIEEFMNLSSQLYQALDKNEFMLHYQPQVNCKSGEIIGLEALLRWNHLELGLVSPGKFIPIIEQTGLIHSIGDWVLRTACKQNKAWQNAGLPKIPIAVNLSVLQFKNPYIVEKVEAILKNNDLDPQYIELEITESVAMHDIHYVVQTLHSFKKKGISISIDDFGTEYSSLQYLKQLPVDKIKIDMSFVQGIEVSAKDAAIVKAIIVLAKSMNLRVIAEGVETQKQLSFLMKHTCNEMQGYYYYKPMPAEQVEEILKNEK